MAEVEDLVEEDPGHKEVQILMLGEDTIQGPGTDKVKVKDHHKDKDHHATEMVAILVPVLTMGVDQQLGGIKD